MLPPFVDLRTVQVAVDSGKLPIAYGAQDISAHESGAYTGEVSGQMLKALGCSYVAVGHSERREYHGEDEQVTLLGWDKEAQEGSFSGDFENQGQGQTLTEQFISQDADIIMPVAGPVGLGAAAAASGFATTLSASSGSE